ncbi:hypothetical protein PG984_007981 [Apiospora sp. TS-2023a]
MSGFADYRIRNGKSNPYFAWNWERLSPQTRQQNPATRYTDDPDRWCWNIAPQGFYEPGYELPPEMKICRFTVTSPAYLYNDPYWVEESVGMFAHLESKLHWFPGKNHVTRVEVGPAKGTHWSTQQLRNIASMWYACEPYLTSLFPDDHLSNCPFEPTHGRCRVAHGEPPAKTDGLCRLAQNGLKFTSLPLTESLQCPEPTQTEEDLAENGPEEPGFYTKEKGRTVQRGTTVLHNGVLPANTFFNHLPTDWGGVLTGRRHNLWRLRRHQVINRIQQAASSPSVALMIATTGRPRWGRTRPAQNGACTCGWRPRACGGGFVGTWAAIVACVVRLGAFEDWDTLCAVMPPPFELVRSAERDERDPDTQLPKYPYGVETRYSAKFDALDMLAKIGISPQVVQFIESKMTEGFQGDGFLWTHRPRAAGPAS